TLYPPLKDSDIRILILHPGQRDDIIRCDLISCPLKPDHKLPYTALSHTWGSTHPSKNIRVNGCAVRIRQNLWLALGALRGETDTRTIWADVLCINQSEILERNRQVARMCDIYRNASCVTI
ncbi:heterokaryon incompatibility protein-domain-containing protein, partial [Leptodontidium sp. 2 PMI_412]